MRLGGRPQNQRPSWITAVLAFVVLIVVVNLLSRQYEQSRTLEQQFAASPPSPGAGKIELPAVPTNLAQLARTTTARLLGGQGGAPLDQTGRNETLEVRINTIQAEDAGLRIQGVVTNIGTAAVPISLDVFKFTDETGTVYAAPGGESANLEPGQQAPLDLTLPIKTPAQLRLQVAPPNQATIELMLVNTPPTPTP